MPDENGANAQGGNSGTTSTANEFKPITTQDDLNRVIADRVSRERAKYSDYDQLKTKAGQFDQLAEASKSELQKAQEASQQAAEKLRSMEPENMRLRAAIKAGLPEDWVGRIQGATYEDMLKDAESLRTQIAPRQGFAHGVRRTAAAPSNMNDVIRSAFGG